MIKCKISIFMLIKYQFIIRDYGLKNAYPHGLRDNAVKKNAIHA